MGRGNLREDAAQLLVGEIAERDLGYKGGALWNAPLLKFTDQGDGVQLGVGVLRD